MKRVVREGTTDAEREEAKAKTVKLATGKIAASMFHDALTCPMEVGRDKQLVHLLLHSMAAAAEVRALAAGVPLTHPNTIAVNSDDDEVAVIGMTTQKLSGSVAECDRALEELIWKEPVEMKATLKGLQQNHLTWEHRAAGAFLFLHPGIYGQGSFYGRTEKVAAALDVYPTTVRKWFSLRSRKDRLPRVPEEALVRRRCHHRVARLGA